MATQIASARCFRYKDWVAITRPTGINTYDALPEQSACLSAPACVYSAITFT
jgi:hypothetical protein